MRYTLLLVSTLAIGVFANPLHVRQSSRQIWVTPTAGNNGLDPSFAMFLPPKAGEIVGEHEQDAIAYGTHSSGSVKQFPSGFIRTKTYLTTAHYVQVTGCINRSKYGLKSSDGGGQFDSNGGDRSNPGAPAGSQCLGYSSFVQQLEPDGQRYCLRCCKSGYDSLCPTNKDTAGCESLMSNGNYNGCN